MTFEDLINQRPRPVKISVEQASEMMGVTQQFLRIGLQQERFPFGVGVKMAGWAYYVNTERFIQYMQGGRVANGAV